jgi:hypothetical protein
MAITLEMHPMSEGNRVSEVAESRAINLRDFRDLNYWAEQFGVPRERVIRAVHTVGPMSHDVYREVLETE